MIYNKHLKKIFQTENYILHKRGGILLHPQKITTLISHLFQNFHRLKIDPIYFKWRIYTL